MYIYITSKKAGRKSSSNATNVNQHSSNKTGTSESDRDDSSQFSIPKLAERDDERDTPWSDSKLTSLQMKFKDIQRNAQ